MTNKYYEYQRWQTNIMDVKVTSVRDLQGKMETPAPKWIK